MKYNNIYNFSDLEKYCNRCSKGSVLFVPTSPLIQPCNTNYLLHLHHSPSQALGYRLLQIPIQYNKTIIIKGIIYSYYTPVGIITDSGALLIGISKEFPFKSVTTKRLVTILNRNTYKLHVEQLKIVLLDLNIGLGWLE